LAWSIVPDYPLNFSSINQKKVMNLVANVYKVRSEKKCKVAIKTIEKRLLLNADKTRLRLMKGKASDSFLL